MFRSARRFDAEHVQLLAVPAARNPGRAGLAVGTKALPLAVDRNRVRRLFREALRHARPDIEAYDVILRLKRRCPRAEFPHVAAEARALLDALVARGGA